MLTRYLKDESGATAIEYGLIAGLISIALIGGARAVGLAINTHFETASSSVNTAGAEHFNN